MKRSKEIFEKTKEITSLQYKVLLELIPYLWPKKRWDLRVRVVLAMIFLGMSNLLISIGPYLKGKIVDTLNHDAGDVVWFYVIGYSLVMMSSTLISNLRDAIFSRVTQEAIRLISLDVFRHMHELSINYHIHRKTGTMLTSFQRGTTAISSIMSMLLFNIMPIILQLIFSVIILVIFTRWYFAIVLIVVMIIYIVFTIAVSHWRNKQRRELNFLDNSVNDRSIDSLLNVETVKLFSATQHESLRYDMALQKRLSQSMAVQWSLSFLNTGQSSIIQFALLVVLLLAVYNVMYSGHMSIGELVMVLDVVNQLVRPLNFLGTAFRMIFNALTDLENLFTLFHEPLDIQDHPQAQNIPVLSLPPIIEFRNVWFSYDPNADYDAAVDPLHPNHETEREKFVLKNLSFTVNQGESLALVGQTGSGKSTVIKLLLRFYDIQSGEILINSYNISSDVTQNSLRENIAVVPQDTVLFNDTLRYNVLYGNPKLLIQYLQTNDDNVIRSIQERVDNVCRKAKILDMIISLENGYDTVVGERGLRLSGGEKQRVAIARALLRDCHIMVFDEATSALDTDTERYIQASLDELANSHQTCITIAHRLSTIIHSTIIIVLDKGNIIESGSHHELLSKSGLYANLWEASQN